MKRLGYSFDYDRVFYSSDEGQYRWSQWLFLTLLEMGLIYRDDATVDWCDTCQTTLASIQVEEGGDLLALPQRGAADPPPDLVPEDHRLPRGERRQHRAAAATGTSWRSPPSATSSAAADGVELDLEGRGGARSPSSARTAGRSSEARFVLLSPAPPRGRGLDRRRPGSASELERDALRRLGAQRPRRSLGAGRSTPAPRSPGPAARSCRSSSRRSSTPATGPPRRSASPRSTRPTATIAAADRPGRERVGGPSRGSVEAPDAAPVPAPARRSATAPTTSRSRASAPGGRRSRSIHCEACGAVPVPEADLPVVLPRNLDADGRGQPARPSAPDFVDVECPRCGDRRQARDRHPRLPLRRPLPLGPGGGAAPRIAERCSTHPDLRAWLPAERLVAGGDSGGFVFDQRIVTKALRDRGPFEFLERRRALRRLPLSRDGDRRGAQDEQAPGQHHQPRRAGQAVGATRAGQVLYAAGPAKTLNWSDGALRFAEPLPARPLDLLPGSLRGARGTSPRRRGRGRRRAHA